jgi:ribosomal protein S27E
LRKETKFQRCIGCLNNFYVKLSDGKKYCSRICYRLHKNRLAYEEFVPLWLAGDTVMTQRGSKGQISGHIRRYLFEKYDSKCVVCSWSKIHPTTGKVPLAVDHENGDWKDNREVNLRLLCPNCHSLTSTYGSLNKGHGRPR